MSTQNIAAGSFRAASCTLIVRFIRATGKAIQPDTCVNARMRHAGTARILYAAPTSIAGGSFT
jgi:hypothetical protein